MKRQPTKENRPSTETTSSAALAQPRMIERFFPDKDTGLSDTQAAELLANGYGNQMSDSNVKTPRQIVRDNTLTFFNFVFVVLAALLLFAGSIKDMTFLFIAFLNTVIGIFQQLRSRKVLSQLNLLAEAKVMVLRSGTLRPLPIHELVREDIIELSAGNQIPADGSVLSGQVRVNESLLTGEADTILKKPGDPLLSGSFIVSGKCRAQLEQVGRDCYAARLTQQAKEDGGGKRSEMMRSLDKLIQFIGFALIPIGIALYYNETAINGHTYAEAIPSVVAALIGMIPEGLYLLTSVALAVSVMRLAKKKTLVHKMDAIETLARVDTLCVDKTGTITSPEMTVREVICINEHDWTLRDAENILSACYAVLDADNDTGKAMAARFQSPTHWHAEKVIPFSSETKWSAVTFREIGTYVIGAPEFVMKGDYAAIAHIVSSYQAEGCRILLLAECDGAAENSQLSGTILPIAFVIINNPIRPQAPETFRYFAQQGVCVKVISGDNPASVSRVAIQAQIEGADRFVDASTLITTEDYDRAVRDYTVFGRVTPEQKQKLIRALQQAKHTVAMTGDGVNDVLALRDADCGIAMASGSDAACQAADLVLLESDFSSLPYVVEEGRRVINNIQRSAALYLVKNIMSFFLSLITLIAGFPYPFVPIQLTLVSALTIGAPSFVLALEPNHDLVKGKFMQNVLRRALPGGLSNIVLMVGIELFALAFQFDKASLSTMATVLMGLVGLLVLYYISRPLDWKRWLLLGSMSVAMLVAVFGMSDIFQLTALNFQTTLVILVFLLLAPSVIWFFEHMFMLGSELWNKRIRYKK